MSLEKAIRYARKNPIEAKGRNSISRFAAVLTDGYSTFVGTNSYKSLTLQARFSKDSDKISRHAEIHAINKAIKGPYRDLSGYTMYVARVLSDGTPAISKPCPVCQTAIAAVGIRDVIWTEDP